MFFWSKCPKEISHKRLSVIEYQLNKQSCSQQRASGATHFIKSTQASIFHLSELTGLQAWVLLLVSQSDICSVAVNHRISWTVLFQNWIYDAAAYRMPSKARTFTHPVNEQRWWQQLGIDYLWRTHTSTGMAEEYGTLQTAGHAHRYNSPMHNTVYIYCMYRKKNVWVFVPMPWSPPSCCKIITELWDYRLPFSLSSWWSRHQTLSFISTSVQNMHVTTVVYCGRPCGLPEQFKGPLCSHLKATLSLPSRNTSTEPACPHEDDTKLWCSQPTWKAASSGLELLWMNRPSDDVTDFTR